MKSTELHVRPIRHWNAQRVRGHVFVCMLAYMIVWQARQAFGSLRDGLDEPADVGELDPTDEQAQHSGGLFESLRGIWDRLSKVQIGRLKIRKQEHEQLAPLSQDLRRILKAAGASLTIGVRRQLGLVD